MLLPDRLGAELVGGRLGHVRHRLEPGLFPRLGRGLLRGLGRPGALVVTLVQVLVPGDLALL